MGVAHDGDALADQSNLSRVLQEKLLIEEANLEFGKRGGPRQPRSSSQPVSDDGSSLDLRATHDTDPESGNSGPVLMLVMVVASVVVGVAAALLYGSLFAGS